MSKLYAVQRTIAKYKFSLKTMISLLGRKADKQSLVLDILHKPFYDQDTALEYKLMKYIFANKDKQPVLMDIIGRPFYDRDTSRDPYHRNFSLFKEEVNKLQRPRILELGARKINQKSQFHGYEEYVVFDIHEDEDVDVAGDIHQLSKYFPEDHFDAVFMISVTEHLAMPWKAVLEINKVMKPGGLLFISTHPIWPAHALPWDFWRFSEEAFTVLLNRFTGFEIVQCDEGLPGLILPFGKDAALMNLHLEPANLGVSVIARKTGGFDGRLSWDLETEEMIDTVYPKG